MNKRVGWLFILAAVFLGFGGDAAAQRRAAVRNVPLGSQVEWSFERYPQPVTYRFGEVSLDVRAIDLGERLVAPEMTVRVAGRSPLVMRGTEVFPTAAHHIGVGRLTRGGPLFVMLQSFTGGAHCCNEIQVALVQPGGIRLVQVGTWDGGPGDFPKDEDGDGAVDIVQGDDSFLYSFASYAESLSPPQIINIIDGSPVDVSDRPSFRPVYERFLGAARPHCLTARREESSNGSCAAYVAAAARIGQFDAAWQRMLSAYNQSYEWDFPNGCAVETQGECPEGSVISYRTFPESLRAFLIERGYISR